MYTKFLWSDVVNQDQDFAKQDQNFLQAEQDALRRIETLEHQLSVPQSKITELTKEKEDTQSNLKLCTFELELLRQSTTNQIELQQQSILQREKEISDLQMWIRLSNIYRIKHKITQVVPSLSKNIIMLYNTEVCVCLVWGEERERSYMEVCVLSAELGEAFVSFTWAITPHYAGPSPEALAHHSYLSMCRPLCTVFLYAFGATVWYCIHNHM